VALAQERQVAFRATDTAGDGMSIPRMIEILPADPLGASHAPGSLLGVLLGVRIISSFGWPIGLANRLRARGFANLARTPQALRSATATPG
jgi:hypothetical protein